MFKNSGFEEEIYRSMEKQLVANQVEDKNGFNKLNRAVDYLYAAASIFDKAGMIKEAEEVTQVLAELAGKR